MPVVFRDQILDVTKCPLPAFRRIWIISVFLPHLWNIVSSIIPPLAFVVDQRDDIVLKHYFPYRISVQRIVAFNLLILRSSMSDKNPGNL